MGGSTAAPGMAAHTVPSPREPPVIRHERVSGARAKGSRCRAARDEGREHGPAGRTMRGNTHLEGQENEVLTRIYLVRHGETEWNATRRIQGQLDIPLNARGREQVARVAAELASQPLTAVYASDLCRARDTAAAVAATHQLPVQTDADLRELHFGEWQGLDLVQLEARYPEQFHRWRQNSLRQRPPGGETIAELQARAAAAFARIVAAHQGETVAVAAHGGPLKALVLHLLGAPLEAYPRLRLHNASLSLIESGRRGPVLVQYNRADFLTAPRG